MDITEIRSIEDLVNFYGEADADQNGLLSPSEIDEAYSLVEGYDLNNDGSFSPFEILMVILHFLPSGCQRPCPCNTVSGDTIQCLRTRLPLLSCYVTFQH